MMRCGQKNFTLPGHAHPRDRFSPMLALLLHLLLLPLLLLGGTVDATACTNNIFLYPPPSSAAAGAALLHLAPSLQRSVAVPCVTDSSTSTSSTNHSTAHAAYWTGYDGMWTSSSSWSTLRVPCENEIAVLEMLAYYYNSSVADTAPYVVTVTTQVEVGGVEFASGFLEFEAGGAIVLGGSSANDSDGSCGE